MLNEKRCAAALKEAFREGGYRVMFEGGFVSVVAGAWAFRVRTELLPREALGRIVEHIGVIPGENEAYFCQKGLTGQTTSLDEALAIWDRLKQLAGKAKTPVKRTRINVYGFSAWQEKKNLRIVLIDPTRLQIVDPDYLNQGRCIADDPDTLDHIFFHGWDDELAVICVAKRGEHDSGMDRLDGFPWGGEAAE